MLFFFPGSFLDINWKKKSQFFCFSANYCPLAHAVQTANLNCFLSICKANTASRANS